MDTENNKVQPNTDEENNFIVLTMDDGTERTFNYEDSFDYKDKRYLCISPAEEMDDIGQSELLIYELSTSENGEDGVLNPILDDAVLEEVYNEYCRRYDEEYEEEGCCCGEDCDCDDENCDCCGGEHENCHCGEDK